MKFILINFIKHTKMAPAKLFTANQTKFTTPSDLFKSVTKYRIGPNE